MKLSSCRPWRMREEDKDYAVSFAVPSDTQGITYIIGRQSCDTRKLEGSRMDVGNLFFGGHEALVVFDRVFVPLGEDLHVSGA